MSMSGSTAFYVQIVNGDQPPSVVNGEVACCAYIYLESTLLFIRLQRDHQFLNIDHILKLFDNIPSCPSRFIVLFKIKVIFLPGQNIFPTHG